MPSLLKPTFTYEHAHIFPGHVIDYNWQRRLLRHRALVRRMSKKIQREKRQLVQRRLDRLPEIDARGGYPTAMVFDRPNMCTSLQRGWYKG